MKRLAILLIAGIVAGCATTPTPSPWNIPKIEDAATQPADLPTLPEAQVIRSDGVEYLAFTRGGAGVLQAFVETAESNTEIAAANAAALDATSEGYNSLIDAGASQRRLADLRQELLEEERRAHKVDSWLYRALLGVAAVAGLAR